MNSEGDEVLLEFDPKWVSYIVTVLFLYSCMTILFYCMQMIFVRQHI